MSGKEQHGNILSNWVKSIRIWSYSGSHSVRMSEIADQNNSEYGHFSRSVQVND